jgi:hypothetical protein
LESRVSMVQIRFRIIPCNVIWSEMMSLDELNNEGSVEGFFSINVNGNTFGYYHDNSLREGEQGFDLITTWFEQLTEAFLLLDKFKYVAVSDIDSHNTWIEFVEINDREISVSILRSEDKTGKGYYVTQPLDNFEYGEWKHSTVDKSEFKAELLQQTDNFITSLEKINTIFLQTRRVKTILSHLQSF